MMDYKIEHFDKYNDKRGQLVVFLRSRNLNKEQTKFGQIYFVTFEGEGIIRANHYHKTLREWFGVVDGKVEVKLKDVKTGKEVNMVLDGKADSYIRLEIGPMVAHGFKSLTPYASVINYTNKEWDAKDVYPMKLF